MQLTPLDSVDHARWFVDALSGDLTVDGLVPPGYDAYARIPHPSESGDDPIEGSLDLESLEVLVTVLRPHTTTPETVWLNLWDGWGQLPNAWVGRPLVRQGGYREYYAFRCALDEVVANSRRFDQIGWEDPDGSVSSAQVTAEYVGDGDPEDGSRGRTDEHRHDLQSPQHWWPEDHAWAVATEIDDDYTVVAGTDVLVDALCAHPGLGAMRVGPRDRPYD